MGDAVEGRAGEVAGADRLTVSIAFRRRVFDEFPFVGRRDGPVHPDRQGQFDRAGGPCGSIGDGLALIVIEEASPWGLRPSRAGR